MCPLGRCGDSANTLRPRLPFRSCLLQEKKRRVCVPPFEGQSSGTSWRPGAPTGSFYRRRNSRATDNTRRRGTMGILMLVSLFFCPSRHTHTRRLLRSSDEPCGSRWSAAIPAKVVQDPDHHRWKSIQRPPKPPSRRKRTSNTFRNEPDRRTWMDRTSTPTNLMRRSTALQYSQFTHPQSHENEIH